MDFIDEKGRIFGVVNVVDVLVVLVIAAVVVAGAALVLLDEPAPDPEVDSTHVTLDVGTQPDFVVGTINEGDTYSPGENTRLTITDVYLTPSGGDTRVLLRAEVQGEVDSGSINYEGAPPRLGRSLDVVTDRYQISGQIRAVGDSDALDREETTVVLRDRIAAPDAREIAAGDEIRLAGRTVATVEDVAVYATGNPDVREVHVEAALGAHRRHGDLRFGDTPVRRGQSLTLPTEDYTIQGSIRRVGGGLDRGEADVLLTDTVDVETADRIAEGDRATVAGESTATVENLSVYNTNNPDRKQVFVGLSLSTVDYGEVPRFGDSAVQRGSGITVRTDDYRLSGPIERVGALEERGSPGERTVTLRLDSVREDFAEAIEPGMTERTGGETVATVTAVDVEPSTLILRGEEGSLGVFDHPIQRDVTITAEMRVRQTTDGVRFKGDPLRQGGTVTLDLGTMTIQAEVVAID